MRSERSQWEREREFKCTILCTHTVRISCKNTVPHITRPFNFSVLKPSGNEFNNFCDSFFLSSLCNIPRLEDWKQPVLRAARVTGEQTGKKISKENQSRVIRQFALWRSVCVHQFRYTVLSACRIGEHQLSDHKQCLSGTISRKSTKRERERV